LLFVLFFEVFTPGMLIQSSEQIISARLRAQPAAIAEWGETSNYQFIQCLFLALVSHGRCP
jgi:hypothetical protein